MDMELEKEKEIIDLTDPWAVYGQISRLSVEKAEAETKIIMEKYNCDVVYEELHRNGQFAGGVIKYVYIGPKPEPITEPPGGH